MDMYEERKPISFVVTHREIKSRTLYCNDLLRCIKRLPWKAYKCRHGLSAIANVFVVCFVQVQYLSITGHSTYLYREFPAKYPRACITDIL